MAVRSSGEARQALQQLIGGGRVPYATLLRAGDLPGGLTIPDPDGGRQWLWSEPPPVRVGGYGDPETYYAHILAGRDDFLRQAGVDYPYDPPGGPEAVWFEPGDAAFWTAAGDLLDHLTEGDTGDVLTLGTPRPQPDLRQVPPE
jgi:hypothetical protein